MLRLYDKNGGYSGWISDDPKLYELKRLTIPMLVRLASNKRGFKNTIIDFILKKPKK